MGDLSGFPSKLHITTLLQRKQSDKQNFFTKKKAIRKMFV